MATTLQPKGYLPRILDARIQEGLDDFGGVCIQGPKYCGKTWTGLSHASSEFSLMNCPMGTNNKELAGLEPYMVLLGTYPRLIDEWQEVPQLWDAVRNRIDLSGKEEKYILTGSSTPKRGSANHPKHSGIGRIEKLMMRPMTLVESQDSTGAVSLGNLFHGEKPFAISPESDLAELSHLITRGGWPGNLEIPRSRAGRLARNYVNAITADTLVEPQRSRNSEKISRLLHSLARNVEQASTTKTLIRDMTAGDDGTKLSLETIEDYIDRLKQLFVLEQIGVWSPDLRSSLRISKKAKYHFIDPSLTAAILGATESMLKHDLKTFGILFESLCMRDLLVYAEALDAKVYFYRDREGFEIDAIIQHHDQSWAGIEITLGHSQTDAAAANLLVVKKRLVSAGAPEPSFLAVIEGLGGYAYAREDGVCVIPIRTLGV